MQRSRSTTTSSGAIRCLVSLGLLALINLCCLRAQAQDKYEISVEPLFGQIYPADRWLPLLIKLTNHTDMGVEGAAIVPTVRPVAIFRIPAHVSPRSTVTLTAYAYLPPTAISPQAGASASPVAVVEWQSTSGARLARRELLGQPDTAGKSETQETPGAPGFLMLAVRGEARDLPDSQSLGELAKQLAGEVSYPLTYATVEAASLPRDHTGYGAVRAVALIGLAPDSLDLLQRKALLEYVRTGGCIVLSAPLDESDPLSSWLTEYLPVQIVGRRLASRIQSSDPGASPIKLVAPVKICEAVPSAGAVLLQDGTLVHAAMKPLGLGRIIFTSFPVSALDPADTRTGRLWRELLNLDSPAQDWSGRALAQKRGEIIEAMIGAPSAPFRHALWLVGACVALVLLPQCLIRGARRPLAFAVGIAATIVLTVGIFVVSNLRAAGTAVLSQGRLVTVSLSPTGGGLKTELTALLGKDDPHLSVSTESGVSLRPVASPESDPAVLLQPPFHAAEAGVRAGRIDRVWQASSAVDAGLQLSVSLQFRSDGAIVSVENQIGETVKAPLLVWNRGVYRLPDLPVGKSEILLDGASARGDYTHAAVLTGEGAAVRGRIVEAMVTPRTDTAGSVYTAFPPIIAGWMESKDSKLTEPLMRSTPTAESIVQQTLLTAPAGLVASPANSEVKIPVDFVVVSGDAAKGVLLDPATGKWFQSMLASSWPLGYAVPREARPLRPIRATIHADLSAGRHKVTLRREQCVSGAYVENPDGAVVAEWDRATGPRSATFDIAPKDLDAGGTLWLRLSVEQSGDAGDALPQWKFNRFDVELEARS